MFDGTLGQETAGVGVMKDNFAIICDKCKKPVDKWETVSDIWSDSIIYIARCHGKVDLCEIDRRFILKSGGYSMIGRAFSTNQKKLESDDR